MFEQLLLFFKKTLTNGVIFLGVYMTPMYEHATVIMILMLIDFMTGLWASKSREIKITSNRMKRSVTKFIVYGVSLIIGLMLAQLYGIAYILIAISFFIATVEVKSISENLWIVYPHFNLFKVIKDNLSSEKSKIIADQNKEYRDKIDSSHHKEQ